MLSSTQNIGGVQNMCQKHYTIDRQKGEHLNLEDRFVIAHLYNQQDKNYSEIAREINSHRTTISREIKKGLTTFKNSDWSDRKVYVPELAQETYDTNATAKGPKLKIGKDFDVAEYIETKIKEKYSPEVIAHKISKNDKFKINIHWKTIYNYIDKGVLLVDRDDLVYGEYKKRKDKKKESKRTKNYKVNRTIRDRPEAADNRVEIGHWEMDLVEGKKGKGEPFLLVLSERAARKEIIELIPDKTTKSVTQGLDRIERRFGVVNFRKIFKTITTDNGSEFKDYEGVEQSFTESSIPRTSQYYCDAYCSWQRGTNENINKMIRRFLPKGSSFKGLTRNAVKRIQKFINNYPRKIFNFKTANEIFKRRTCQT